MVFTVDAWGLTGFVTPSDLNKHPVRTHFYLLLADLEMTMAAKTRDAYADVGEVLNYLSSGRRGKILDRHGTAIRFNIDADYLTAFEFPDLLTIVQKTGLFEEFGYSTSTEWRARTNSLKLLRDQVMHPRSAFLGRRSIDDLIEIDDQLRLMLVSAAAT